jgi:hypothetical protein
LPEISAGWIVSGAPDPAVFRNDQGRNVCAHGIGDIAAAKTAAAADGISRGAVAIEIARARPRPRARAIAIAIAIAIARAIAVIVTPAVETEGAIVTMAVTDKETTGTTAPAAESGEAAMKAAAVETPPVKTAAEAVFRVSGSGE